MMTEIVDAGTRDNAQTAALTFAHKLSQLNFKVQKDATLQGDVTLTSITVKNADCLSALTLQLELLITRPLRTCQFQELQQVKQLALLLLQVLQL